MRVFKYQNMGRRYCFVEMEKDESKGVSYGITLIYGYGKRVAKRSLYDTAELETSSEYVGDIDIYDTLNKAIDNSFMNGVKNGTN